MALRAEEAFAHVGVVRVLVAGEGALTLTVVVIGLAALIRVMNRTLALAAALFPLGGVCEDPAFLDVYRIPHLLAEDTAEAVDEGSGSARHANDIAYHGVFQSYGMNDTRVLWETG